MLAFACVAVGVAVPASAAQSDTRGEPAVAQTVVPGAAIGSEPVARGCYNGGQITLDNGTVMDATGYGNPARIEDYNSTGGTNQQWALCQLSDGYDEIVSDYNGNLMCLNVDNASYTSGTHLLAWPCNTVVAGNEQWRRPENTPDTNYSGFFYLVPAGDWNLCANVAGGLGIGHQLVLYSCNAQDNEAFGVAGSTRVKDRLGIATYAASYVGYQDNPAGTFCNQFSRYWSDGSTAGCGSTGNYNTEWCADFAAYVWRFGGNVSFNYRYAPGYINGGAASFAQYAKVKGTWHAAGSGYEPKPGDVAVYGLNGDDTFAGHAAVVIGLSPGDSGPNVVNGDYIFDAEYKTDETQASGSLSGYASPPGL